jgi:hypothetical protein
MGKISTVKQYDALDDEQKSKVMFVIHGILFEDGQVQGEIFFGNSDDEAATLDSVNRILKEWMALDIELGPKLVTKLLKNNGDM